MSSAVTSGGGVGSLAPPEIWRLCLTWLERSAEVITASATALNAINVFPVADSDTGTNLQQTLTGIIAHLSGEAVDDDWTAELVAGARGRGGGERRGGERGGGEGGEGSATTSRVRPTWWCGRPCCPPTATRAPSSRR